MGFVFIAENANENLKAYLIEKGYKLIEILKTDSVYEAVSRHSDIYLCKIGNFIIVSQELLEKIKDKLISNNISYIVGASELGYKYPENIKYNGVQIGKYFVHNTKYTDTELLKKAEEYGLQIINVSQGYSKCNIVVVDENSIITSDNGLQKQLQKHEIDVLLIQKGYIKLEGFTYGFIGGTSGKIGNSIIFNGNLKAHPDYDRINTFVESRGLNIVYFPQYPLEDIGSIITVGED